MNPLDLPGPQFLVLFAMLFAAALVLAVGLQKYLRRPGGAPSFDADHLAPYEVAFLAGGAEQAVNAAIASLVQRRYLTVPAVGRELTTGTSEPVAASQLEAAVYRAVERAGAGSASVAAARDAAATALRPIIARLQKLGLVMDDDAARTARWVPLILLLSVPLFGLVKLWVGHTRGRPIGFLAIACFLTAWLTFGLFGHPPFRSRTGDRALARLKRASAALQAQAGRRAHELASDDLVLAIGLFGTGILASGEMAPLQRLLKPPAAAAGGGSGGSCGSGCSSGGGGSCGGGCGGGCGGCGS